MMLGRIMKVKKSSNRVPCFLFLWEEIDYWQLLIILCVNFTLRTRIAYFCDVCGVSPSLHIGQHFFWDDFKFLNTLEISAASYSIN